ncbi:MAG: hypothetical protein ACOC4G_01155 [Bacillota bacterium]
MNIIKQYIRQKFRKNSLINSIQTKKLVICFLLAILILLINLSPVKGEKFNIKGDKLTYDKETGLIVIKGDINGDYDKFYLFSEEVVINLGEGKTEKQLYNPDKIELEEGGFTGCELDNPHYFLKSSKTVIHPGEYLEAYNVVFRELEGKLPLFYWPYLYISLKREDQSVVPEFGYDSRRGWFIKTTYNYDVKNELPLEIYLDYYTETGEAGGFKQYYIYEPEQKGYFSVYGQRNKENVSGLSRWFSNFSYENKNILLNPDLYFGYKDYNEYSLVSGEINLTENTDNVDLEIDSYYEKEDYHEVEKKNNNQEVLEYGFDYYHDLPGIIDFNVNYNIDWQKQKKIEEIVGEDEAYFNLNYYQIENLDLNLGYEREKNVDINLDEIIEDKKEIELDYSWENDWYYNLDLEQGNLKKKSEVDNENINDRRWEGITSVEKRFSDYSLSFLLQREEPDFDEEGVRYFALPEVILNYNPSYNFEYNYTAGNFYESESGTQALRGGANVSYNNKWEIISGNYFSTEQKLSGYIYRLLEQEQGDDILTENKNSGVILHESEISLENHLTENLIFNNSFVTINDRGRTPFQFDKMEKEKKLKSKLDYKQDKMELSLDSGYNYITDEYLLLEGILKFYPLPGWTVQLGTTYDINQKFFEDDLILKNRFEKENISFNTVMRYDLNQRDLHRLENELIYEVPGDWGWYIENNISFDYEEENSLEEAYISLKKKMHCRELWFTYDHLDESFIFTYKLDLFPDHSVTMGRSEEDSFIFETGIKEMLREEEE